MTRKGAKGAKAQKRALLCDFAPFATLRELFLHKQNYLFYCLIMAFPTYMYKRKFKPGDLFLILVNMIPLAGVLFRDWDPKQMFLIYCLETVIIGIFNIVKMLVVIAYEPRRKWNVNQNAQAHGLFLVLFFIVHYGFFVFVQMALFAGVSGITENGSFGTFSFIAHIPKLLNPETKIVLYTFIGMYAFQTTIDFILSGKYRLVPLNILMFSPYFRIVIQQFVVILGSFFLQFGAGKIFMIIFVFVKLAFELFLDYDRLLDKAAKMEDAERKGRAQDV